MANFAEQSRATLKIVETNQRVLIDEVLKKQLRCIVCGDPCGHDKSCASARPQDRTIHFSENRVGVDVPTATEWVPPARTHKRSFSIGLVQRFEPGPPECRVFLIECPYEPFAGGCVRRCCDIGPTFSEPFLL